MTDIEKDRFSELVRRVVDGDTAWTRENDICLSHQGNYVLLNYGGQKRNPFNALARGLVLRKAEKEGNGHSPVCSFPFVRFFNQGDPDAAELDIERSSMIEKLDGSMLAVSFVDDRWLCHTRRELLHDQSKPLADSAFKFLNSQLKMSEGKKTWTYMFELVDGPTRNVTQYSVDQSGLYLIGARDLESFGEVGEEQLDELAESLNALRPRTWDPPSSQSEIEARIERLRHEIPGFEGFVFRDQGTGKRVKVKDPEFVRHSFMLAELSWPSLLKAYFLNETAEVVAYFPQAKQRLETIHTKVNQYLNDGRVICDYWLRRQKTERLPRKRLVAELTSECRDKFLINAIVKILERHEDALSSSTAILQQLRILSGAEGSKNSNPKRLLKIIGLTEK